MAKYVVQMSKEGGEAYQILDKTARVMVSDEVTARESAIAAEASARQEADQAEATARETADANLANALGTVPSGQTAQGQITDLKNALGTVPSGKTAQGQITDNASNISDLKGALKTNQESATDNVFELRETIEATANGSSNTSIAYRFQANTRYKVKLKSTVPFENNTFIATANVNETVNDQAALILKEQTDVEFYVFEQQPLTRLIIRAIQESGTRYTAEIYLDKAIGYDNVRDNFYHVSGRNFKDPRITKKNAVSGKYTSIPASLASGGKYYVCIQASETHFMDRVIASRLNDQYVTDPVCVLLRDETEVWFHLEPQTNVDAFMVKETNGGAYTCFVYEEEAEDKAEQAKGSSVYEAFVTADEKTISATSQSGSYTEIPAVIREGKIYQVEIESSVPYYNGDFTVYTVKGTTLTDHIGDFISGENTMVKCFTATDDAEKLIMRVARTDSATYTVHITEITNKYLEDIIETGYRKTWDLSQNADGSAFTEIPFICKQGETYRIRVRRSEAKTANVDVETNFRGDYNVGEIVNIKIGTITGGTQEAEFIYKAERYSNRISFREVAASTISYSLHIDLIENAEKSNLIDVPIITVSSDSIERAAGVFNSVEIAKDIQTKILDIKQPGDMAGNGVAKLAVIGDYMFIVQQQHNGPDDKESIRYNNFIRVYKVTFPGMEVVDQMIIAERGGSYLFDDGITYTFPTNDMKSSPYSPVCVKYGNKLVVLFSAPDGTCVRYVRVIINPDTFETESYSWCHCNGDIDYCGSINEIDLPSVGGSQVVYENGYYYMGAELHGNGAILRTSDLVNFTVYFEVPTFGLFVPQYEIGLDFETVGNKKYMFLAVRTNSQLEDAKGFVYLMKVDTENMEVVEMARINDSFTLPYFVEYNNVLYLYSGTYSRKQYSFTVINKKSIANSYIYCSIGNQKQGANPSMVVSGNEIFMAMTESYITKIRLNYYGWSDAYDIIDQLLQNYIA